MTTPTDWVAEFAAVSPGPERKALYAIYLRSAHWWAARAGALERAEGSCQTCNGTKKLQVHHRTYERVGEERPADLIVLCEKCHQLFHGKSKTQKPKKTKPKKQPKVKAVKTGKKRRGKRSQRPLKGSVRKPVGREMILLTKLGRRVVEGTYSTPEIVMLTQIDRGTAHVRLEELCESAPKRVQRVAGGGPVRWQITHPEHVTEYQEDLLSRAA